VAKRAALQLELATLLTSPPSRVSAGISRLGEPVWELRERRLAIVKSASLDRDTAQLTGTGGSCEIEIARLGLFSPELSACVTM
jgi:hypothetical protein